MLLDVLQELLHVVELDVAEEVQQKGADRHHAGIEGALGLAGLEPPLDPAHLVALPFHDFHLQLFIFDLDLLQGYQLNLLNLDFFPGLDRSDKLFLLPGGAVQFGNEGIQQL